MRIEIWCGNGCFYQRLAGDTTMRLYLDEIQKGGRDPDYDTILADDSVQDTERGAAEIYNTLASMAPRRFEWPGVGGLEQTLQLVRSQDSSNVADGHDGCNDTEQVSRTREN